MLSGLEKRDLNAWAELRSNQSAVYRLFSRLWLREIDDALLEQLSHAEIRQELDQWDLDFGELKSDSLEDLAVDFCRIFLGPSDHVLPLQSVATQGLLQAQAVSSMREYLGYVNVKQDDHQLLDHLGFQFRVMAEILAAEVSEADLPSLWQLAVSFFEDHVVWGKAICERAADRAASQFYSSMIRSTGEFIDSETKLFRERTVIKA